MSIEIDPELLDEIQKGNSTAFGQLVDQCSHFIYALALKMHGDREEAWDSTQDSLVKIWQKFHTYQPSLSFTKWIYRIVINTCLDKIRKAQRRGTFYATNHEESMKICSPENPEQALEEKQLVEFVKRASNRLSAKQHAVFVLHDLEDFTQEEISKMLSMTKGRVKSNLYYARKAVRQMLVINETINQKNEM